MKVEIGMHIRSKSGYLCKIININNFREPDKRYGAEASYHNDIIFLGDGDISKASYEPIDLVKIGDYVNGNEVIAISEFKDGSRYIEFDEGKYLCKIIKFKQ